MKKTILLFLASIIISITFVNSFAQEKETISNKTYKIYTYTIVGSNTSGNQKLPNNLPKAFEGIKNNFPYSNYQLLSTQFQLIKEKGSIEYKSILKDFENNGNSASPIFAEWTYRGFAENEMYGKDRGSFSSFRFGLRIPIKTSSVNIEGKTTNIINYEALGLSATNIDFAVGEPTLFASFPIESIDKTLFFVVYIEEVK